MLNLQFAELMELTDTELQEVSGGQLVYCGPLCGAGGGIPTPGWKSTNLRPGYFDFLPPRRRG